MSPVGSRRLAAVDLNNMTGPGSSRRAASAASSPKFPQHVCRQSCPRAPAARLRSSTGPSRLRRDAPAPGLRRGTISRLSRATSKLADFVISTLLLSDHNLAARCAALRAREESSTRRRRAQAAAARRRGGGSRRRQRQQSAAHMHTRLPCTIPLTPPPHSRGRAAAAEEKLRRVTTRRRR